jgi:hypothetical protein
MGFLPHIHRQQVRAVHLTNSFADIIVSNPRIGLELCAALTQNLDSRV